MSTAVALHDAGLRVTLLESAQRLGGRASSFEDTETGESLDNCQHVLLGCCTNLLDFYGRVGASDKIRFDKAVHFRDAAGRRHDLFATPGLPAPGHFSASFAKFGVLTVKERVAYARAMLAMLRLGRAGRAKLANVRFGDWLDQHGQPASLVEKMYEPVLIGALNESVRDASAMYAVQVFQDAMLAHSRGYAMGVPTCSLSELYDRMPSGPTPLTVRLGARMAELVFDGDRVTGVTLVDGETLSADAVVLATNHHAVQRWVPADRAAGDVRFARLNELQSVPILGVHLWFDRPVLAETHAALLTGPLQWLFRKDAEGRAVHGVISAARDWAGKPKDESLKQFEQQVRAVLPLAREATLLRGVIVVEKRATFSPVPGVDELRPFQAPPVGGIQQLYLAGDYTRTGWPATMEGAVRSGYLAADAVLAGRGVEHASFVVSDLPAQWPARLLGLRGVGPV